MSSPGLCGVVHKAVEALPRVNVGPAQDAQVQGELFPALCRIGRDLGWGIGCSLCRQDRGPQVLLSWALGLVHRANCTNRVTVAPEGLK